MLAARAGAVFVVLMVFAMGGVVWGSHSTTTPTLGPVGPAVPNSAGQVLARGADKSVVDIYTTSTTESVAGTGIILSRDGLVLTNNHVINGADGVTARVAGTGAIYNGVVVGDDPGADVAVVQLNGVNNLVPAKLGNSDKLVVGEAVVAIGNALNRPGAPTVTTGRVSALGQNITASVGGSNPESLKGLIESSAVLNPGNSGGPLLALAGADVMGMNTAANTASSGLSGATIGYAIPINKALVIAHQIMAKKASASVHIGPRGRIGVVVEDRSSYVAGKGAYSGSVAPGNNGVIVISVEPGSGASGAGVESGALITAVDGKPAPTLAALRGVIASTKPGEKVDLAWTGVDGTGHHSTITLGRGAPD
jgi:S1-C subfamily serine protease